MRKRLVVIAIMIHSVMYSYAQDSLNMIEILDIEQDIVTLEKKITSLIKKEPKIAHIEGLRQFHLFWTAIKEDSLKKEDYLNHSFLYKLIHPGYYDLGSNFLFIRKKEYLRSQTYITDSTGTLVGTSDATLVSAYSVFNPSSVRLAKMFFNKELDYVFYIGGRLGNYIGIKGNNLYALENTKDGLKIYPWKEFIERCYEQEGCFDKWIYQRKNVK
ncbi:MAG: hypothetical protein LBV43_04820 [Prevotella sp.]|jgi:hypothetical protein|nr:hypothetical protein [Prevotella sp.]